MMTKFVSLWEPSQEYHLFQIENLHIKIGVEWSLTDSPSKRPATLSTFCDRTSSKLQSSKHGYVSGGDSFSLSVTTSCLDDLKEEQNYVMCNYYYNMAIFFTR